MRRRLDKSEVKYVGSTGKRPLKLPSLSPGEDGGIPGVVVKCVNIRRTPMAKAAIWPGTDAQARKLGERTGLDTLVVLAVNDGH